MSKIYEESGYVNWDYIYNETLSFCMVVGPRGTGKTFGLLKYLLEKGEKFIYMRRLGTQLEQCGSIDGNPFRAVNSAIGKNIIPLSSKHMIKFCDCVQDEQGKVTQKTAPLALGVALSTFSTMRGIDFSDVGVIVFDEAVPMIGEKPIKDEFNAFLNLYETVNRNRELNGQRPVKCFLLGNANKLGNPYYLGWGFMKTALNMIRGNQMMWRSEDQTRLMILLFNSAISKKKSETALYRNANRDFVSMAIDNAFRTDSTMIKSIPLKQCSAICGVGEIGIYKIKASGEFYVSKVAPKDRYYDGYGFSLKLWRHDFTMLKLYYLNNRIIFESYEIELIFREYIDLY